MREPPDELQPCKMSSKDLNFKIVHCKQLVYCAHPLFRCCGVSAHVRVRFQVQQGLHYAHTLICAVSVLCCPAFAACLEVSWLLLHPMPKHLSRSMQISSQSRTRHGAHSTDRMQTGGSLRSLCRRPRRTSRRAGTSSGQTGLTW